MHGHTYIKFHLLSADCISVICIVFRMYGDGSRTHHDLISFFTPHFVYFAVRTEYLNTIPVKFVFKE